MEPLTHFLTGAVIARTGFNRTTALATTTLVLAAEAPDIDVLAYLGGPVYGFAQHRGITHTLLGTPLVAALVLAVVFGFDRVRKRLRENRLQKQITGKDSSAPANAPPVRWGLLFLYACGSVLVHILLDFTNNYGVRPFLPFQNHWYSWDIVFIVEPLLYVVLLGALVLPALFGLINDEIGVRRKGPRGRGAAFAAILAVLAIWGVRDQQHRRALAVLDSQTYRGEEPLRVAAYPYHSNPFQWYGVVETANFYQRMVVDSLRSEPDSRQAAQVRFKPEETPVTLAAKKSYLGRVYMDWAKYPVLEVQALQAPQAGYQVRFMDLRFAYLERQSAPLTANEVLTPDLQVTDSWFDSNFGGPAGGGPGHPGGE